VSRHQARRIGITAFIVGVVIGAAGGYGLTSGQISSLQGQILDLTRRTSDLEKQIASLQRPTYAFMWGSKSFTLISTVSNDVVVAQEVPYSVWIANHYLDSNGRVWGVGLPKSTGLIFVIDPLTLKLVKTFDTGAFINNVEVTPDGKLALVPVSGKDEVWVYDTVRLELVKKIKGGLWPCDVDFTPDGKMAYVPNRNDDTVSVIDVAKLEIVKTIQFEKGAAPYMLTVSPNGRYVFVENPATRGENMNLEPTGARKSEGVIDVATNAVIKYITLDGTPVADEFTPDSRLAYVTLIDVGKVAVVDVGTLSVVKVVEVGRRPIGVDVRPDGKFVYIANAGSDNVSVIDTARNEVVKTIATGKGPVASLILPRAK